MADNGHNDVVLADLIGSGLHYWEFGSGTLTVTAQRTK